MSNALQSLHSRFDGDDPEETLSELVAAAGCQVITELRELTRKGWADRSLDAHFAKRIEKSATSSTPNFEVNWIKTYWRSMKEMDDIKQFIPSGALNFLDLGCAPGGYSKFVMNKNEQAFGTGICLPVHDGGHYFILPRYLRSRYTVHYADMTKYDLLDDGSNEFAPPLPFRPASFGLVIADGHPLWTREFSPAVSHILLLSQLIIALIAVKEGGTIFIKLSKPASFMAAPILYLLDAVSTTLETIKPRTVHGNRGTFYAIARGIQRGSLLERYLDELRSMRQEFMDSPPGWELYIRIYEQIASPAQLKREFIPRLIELGTPVWEVQKEGMAWFLEKKGAKKSDAHETKVESDGSTQGSENGRGTQPSS